MSPVLFLYGFTLGIVFAICKTKKHKAIVAGIGLLSVLVEVFLLPK